MNVNLRDVKIFMSDDSRKIEVYSKVGEVEYNTDNKEEIEFLNKVPVCPIVYGVMVVNTIQGPREVKFHIPLDGMEITAKESEIVNAAFNKFKSIADDVVKKIEQDQKEYIKRMKEMEEKKIVTIPAEALNNLPKG